MCRNMALGDCCNLCPGLGFNMLKQMIIVFLIILILTILILLNLKFQVSSFNGKFVNAQLLTNIFNKSILKLNFEPLASIFGIKNNYQITIYFDNFNFDQAKNEFKKLEQYLKIFSVRVARVVSLSLVLYNHSKYGQEIKDLLFGGGDFDVGLLEQIKNGILNTIQRNITFVDQIISGIELVLGLHLDLWEAVINRILVQIQNG